MIDSIIENDLVPVLTLHHFTHPLWFDDLGAFEKSDNIKFFIKCIFKRVRSFLNKINFIHKSLLSNFQRVLILLMY